MSKKYDFETLISRKNQGSYKWEGMYKEYPDLPDDIVPFSVADMELQIAPEIKEGLKKYIDEAILGYTGTYEEYFEAVINWMKRKHNFDIQKEWIVTSSGVVSALFDSVKAFTEKEDGVIVFTPVYYPFYSAIKLNERKLLKAENSIETEKIDTEYSENIDMGKINKIEENKDKEITKNRRQKNIRKNSGKKMKSGRMKENSNIESLEKEIQKNWEILGRDSNGNKKLEKEQL